MCFCTTTWLERIRIASALHIRDVNENILDRVYSAVRLMAYMSAEMDVNSLLFLSAAPLLRVLVRERGRGQKSKSMEEEEDEEVERRERARDEQYRVCLLQSNRNGDLMQAKEKI